MTFAPPFSRVFSPTFDRRNATGNGLLNNLVAYWKLDETSGTRSDSYGANHLGTVGSPGYGIGKISNAVDIVAGAGAEAYLSVADNAALSITGSITIAGWIRYDVGPTSGGVRPLISKWKSSTNNRSYFVDWDQSSNRIRLAISNNGTAATIVSANNLGIPTTGTWYFIAAWYNGSSMNISVNNGATDSVAYSSGIFNGNNNLMVGATEFTTPPNATGHIHDGLIDEVGIWNTALTAAQITTLYNSGAGLAYSAFTT